MATGPSLRIEALDDPAIQAAVSRLVRVSQSGGATLISMPITYPSGSSVGIRVDRHARGYYVSDFASGYREAESFGAERSFKANVKKIIEAYGLEYGVGHQIGTIVTPEQLTGAIRIVAAASHEVVQRVFAAAPEWDEEEVAAGLYQRLVGLFGLDHVRAKASMAGASSVSWHFAARVNLDGQNAVFDVVSPHHASVFSTVSKFNDLIRLEAPTSTVAVVHSKAAMGKWLPLLSQTATVIEDDASDDTLRNVVAEAA